MGYFYLFIIVILSRVLFLPSTHELQTSQTQVLLQIRKHLEYPSALQILENYSGDICNISQSAHLTISCQENSITELRVMGDKLSKVSEFNGFAIPNKTLSESFSIDSFVTTLSRLTRLRVLTLVSLGIWGPLPDNIHRLSSLKFLDLSSNFLFGEIPAKISLMVELNALVLDSNYFNDTVPDWLDSLSNLTVLGLKRNRLKGPFPSSVCKITTLTNLAFSQNEISGKLPNLSTLSNLHTLDLRENQLESELQIMPKSLVTVLLSRNKFSGEIPGHFADMVHLQHLDLSFNHLTGPPPAILFSLPNISYLNLAFNMLSGHLPNNLICGGKLGFVDISDNKLIGDLPSCLGGSSEKRMVKFSGNCFSSDSHNQHRASFCKESLTSGKKSKGREITVVLALICGGIIIIVLLALGVLFLYKSYRKRRRHEPHVLPKVVQENPPSGVSSEFLANATVKMGTQTAPASRTFSFEELKEVTNNFDQSMFLGEGSIGKIYRGKLENGTYVAVRSLALSKKYSVLHLKARLDMLTRLHHPHLVALLGHCIHGAGQDASSANKVFLIYEYVPNGNYRTYLSENCSEKILNWSDRLAVLIGIAKGVHFLHTGLIPGSFNNLLKTNNVLLDEHRIAKLSDFGMSIITEDNEKLEAKGEGIETRKRKSLENDVYNFGYILLESLVGPIVTGKGEASLLNEMVSFGSQDGRRRILDPIVLTTCSQESLSRVIEITKKCISPEASSRPSFEDVLWNLQYAAQVQATADADQKSDSTT